MGDHQWDYKPPKPQKPSTPAPEEPGIIDKVKSVGKKAYDNSFGGVVEVGKGLKAVRQKLLDTLE